MPHDLEKTLEAIEKRVGRGLVVVCTTVALISGTGYVYGLFWNAIGERYVMALADFLTREHVINVENIAFLVGAMMIALLVFGVGAGVALWLVTRGLSRRMAGIEDRLDRKEASGPPLTVIQGNAGGKSVAPK